MSLIGPRALLLLLLPIAAYGQGGAVTSLNVSSVTCGTGNSVVLNGGFAGSTVTLHNPASSANSVWVNPNGTATTAPPSFDVPPGADFRIPSITGGYAPTINCIASSPTTVTLGYQ